MVVFAAGSTYLLRDDYPRGTDDLVPEAVAPLHDLEHLAALGVVRRLGEYRFVDMRVELSLGLDLGETLLLERLSERSLDETRALRRSIERPTAPSSCMPTSKPKRQRTCSSRSLPQKLRPAQSRNRGLPLRRLHLRRGLVTTSTS
jgi:hypothetical protein